MSSEGSVTLWLRDLCAGDRGAADKLWERYFAKLVRLARSKLAGSARSAADEEDAALSAFDSFCRRAEQGGFPALDDRDNLWRLLVVITARKAYDQLEYQRRLKRDERVRGRPMPGELPHSCFQVDQWIATEPTPEMAAMVADECHHLLAVLEDETLRDIALAKMEGYTNAEIAERLGCVVRTVERKLRLIRQKWTAEAL